MGSFFFIRVATVEEAELSSTIVSDTGTGIFIQPKAPLPGICPYTVLEVDQAVSSNDYTQRFYAFRHWDAKV
jgi:hypothetical protein